METNQETSVHNGDITGKKDAIILTTVNAIAADKSNPGPDRSSASTQVATPPRRPCVLTFVNMESFLLLLVGVLMRGGVFR